MHKKFAISLLSLAFVLSTAAPALAHNGADDSTDISRSNRTEVENKIEHFHEEENEIEHEREVENEEIHNTNAAKKEEIRVKVCEARVDRIKTRAAHIEEVSKAHLDKLDALLAKVNAFVTSKNLTVQNLDELKADVIAKQQVAITARAAISDTAAGFSCTDPNRKAKIAEIKIKVEVFKAAAKAYRTSLKALFGAVKTAAEAAEGSNN